MEQRTSSRTNKGQYVSVKYEDEQAQQQSKKSKEQPKRQPRRQVEKEQEEEPINVNKETPKAPSKSKKTESRTLNLDLSDVPPSDDIKFSEDFSFYTHPFWKNNFYTPKDNTTQEYIEATDKLNDFLPANFRLI
jgi:sRNA-binding protein